MPDRKRSYKPLDFGNGLVAGSVNDRGRLVSLNTAHPDYGYVTLSNLDPFPEERRYDPAFVRRYRAEQASPDLPGFGFDFGPPIQPPVTVLIQGALPLARFEVVSGTNLEIVTFAPFTGDDHPYKAALQLYAVENSLPTPVELSFQWNGSVSLTRSSYAQLTEGGPIPPPEDHYITEEEDSIFALENTGAGVAVAFAVVAVGADGVPLDPVGGWRASNSTGGRVSLSLPGTLKLEKQSKIRLAAICGWGENRATALAQVRVLLQQNLLLLQEKTAGYWADISKVIKASNRGELSPEYRQLIRHALVYILACCAVPLDNDSTCLITDHQLLPLAWTRDAYFAIQALLALRQAAHKSGDYGLTGRLDALVRQHLIWLFEVAERPQNFWGRAYLTNGRCKDVIFQLDQQCYPLLELADYVAITGDKGLAQRFKPRLEEALAGLLSRKAAQAWLFPTGETPADDKVEMPYHLSSQITVWYLLQSLAELNVLENYSPAQLLEMAGQVRQDIYRYMAVENKGRRMFCYLTDLEGNFRFYHDANDWPLALAPQWGFCLPDDPVWSATLDFGFSPANKDGYYTGKFSGLGSVHTPHPWPLGDIQELFIAHLQKDNARLDKIRARLLAVACRDGALPEAYREQSGEVASRHWFAWPGAMLALVELPR